MRDQVVLAGVLVLAAVAAEGRTIVVDPSGTGDARTIQAAAARTKPGDTVLVKPGVYREEVRIPCGGVTYRSEVRGAAVVKGSEVWRNAWTPLGKSGRVYASPINDTLFRGGRNPYLTTISIGPKDRSYAARPLTNAVVTAGTFAPRTLGQVFADGEPCTEVMDVASLKRTAGTWMVSHDGRSVWLHPFDGAGDSNGSVVEWSVRGRVFHAQRRGLRDVTVDGFTFEHCANQGPFPQVGMVDTRTGTGWTIENCTVRHAKAVGIAVGSETWDAASLTDVPEPERKVMITGGNTVRNCRVSDCGVAGISAWHAGRVRILNNTVERCNRGVFGWPERYWGEAAGIKAHVCHGTIAGNIVRDNEMHGIWLDTGFKDSRVTGNVIVNNRDSGIHLESGSGPSLVDNNVIAFTRAAHDPFHPGDGIYSHGGSSVTVAHNLLYRNAGAGVRFRCITWPKKDADPIPHPVTNNVYANNLFVMNVAGQLVVPPPDARISADTRSSGNLYVLHDYPRGGISLPFRFAAYNVGGVKWGDVLAQVNAASARPPMPMDEWRALGNPVSLEAWRAIWKQDLDSVVVRAGAGELATYDLTFTFPWPKEAKGMKVSAVSGIGTDFFGAAMSADGVRPGPFQLDGFDERPQQFAIRPYGRNL